MLKIGEREGKGNQHTSTSSQQKLSTVYGLTFLVPRNCIRGTFSRCFGVLPDECLIAKHLWHFVVGSKAHEILGLGLRVLGKVRNFMKL